MTLVFPPCTFAPGFRTLELSEAIRLLLNARHGTALSNATAPSHEGYRAHGIAIEAGQSDFLLELKRGELAAYVHLPSDPQFYRIPTDYWNQSFSDCSLSGRLFAFPTDQLVPPELIDQAVVLLADEVQTYIDRSSADASILRALTHHATAAKKAFEAAADALVEEFSRSTRLASGYLARRLCEAADDIIMHWLVDVRPFARRDRDRSTLLEVAHELADRFYQRIEEDAISASGRISNPGNSSRVAECRNAIDRAIENEVWTWLFIEPETSSGEQAADVGDPERRSKWSDLPPVADLALKSWFEGLSDTERLASLLDLHAAAKLRFPQNHVTRERVRRLAPGRKRGPRGIGGNRSAEFPPK